MTRLDEPKDLTAAPPKPKRKWLWKIPLYGLPILFLLALALPNFLPARSVACKNACINNIRQIDGAKEQWALENKTLAQSVPRQNDLAPYLKGGWPTCPGGGSYIIGAIGQPAGCTFGHTH